MWLFTTESPTTILLHYLGFKFTLGVVATFQYIILKYCSTGWKFWRKTRWTLSRLHVRRTEKLEGHYKRPSVVRRQAHSTHIPPATATKILCLVAKGHPSMKHSSQSVHLFANGWTHLNKESFRLEKVHLTTYRVQSFQLTHCPYDFSLAWRNVLTQSLGSQGELEEFREEKRKDWHLHRRWVYCYWPHL